jgi:hypothetical protein
MNCCENHPNTEAKWPSTTADRGLCQECWERQCSEKWWEMFSPRWPSETP